ncbi:MAG: hypothetical protein KA010_00010 [Saprospiraceae bacterium]|nr:hypothetical protein [Saprospiraceae bacterium]
MNKKKSKLRNQIGFLQEGIKNFMTVGSVTPSSKFLCKEMISPIDFSVATNLVEIGAGDGVITTFILERMRPDAVLVAFEVNKVFYDKLTKINDPRLIVIFDSAENVEHHTSIHFGGHHKVDAIVSALPFVILPEELTQSILQSCKKSLTRGGLFIQYHYSIFLKKLYKNTFGNVRMIFEPLNIPPAVIFVSKKE